jgi:hypothetical protein
MKDISNPRIIDINKRNAVFIDDNHQEIDDFIPKKEIIKEINELKNNYNKFICEYNINNNIFKKYIDLFEENILKLNVKNKLKIDTHNINSNENQSVKTDDLFVDIDSNNNIIPKFKPAWKLDEENKKLDKFPETPIFERNIINKNKSIIKDEPIKNDKNFNFTFDSNTKSKFNNQSDFHRLTDLCKNLQEKIDSMDNKHKDEINNLKETYNNDINEYKESILKLQEDLQIKTNLSNTKRPKNLDKNKKPEKTALEKWGVNVYSIRNTNEVLDFMATEEKVMVRFQSMIVEKIDINDNKIWNEIFKFAVDNGKVRNSRQNKLQFKNKIIRCNELYKEYGENLGRFKIKISYLGLLSEDDWKIYLKDFDILYKQVYKDEIKCPFIYTDNTVCGIYSCKTKHKKCKSK